MSGFVILIFLVVVILVLKLCLSILKGSIKIFRMGGSNANNRQSNRRYQNQDESYSSGTEKKFSKDEGKYIDYEEIKEEN